MNLNHEQEQAVLSAIRAYRACLTQTLHELEDNAGHEVCEHISRTLDNLYEVQSGIEDLEEPSDEAESGSDTCANTDKPIFPPKADAHVLICDDDPTSRELLSMMLEDQGFSHIVVAANGTEAIHAAEETQNDFNLIICDWKMPEMTGLEVHKQLMDNNKLSNTHFILLTAIEDDVLKSRTVRQGIDDYIVKPIEEHSLSDKLSTLFPASDA